MPTRKFVWAREEVNLVVSAQDTGILNLLSDFEAEYGADLLGATVMRLRGRLDFEPASAANAVGAAGVRVITESTAVLGAVAAQGPLSDAHADWMAYEPLLWNSVDPLRQTPIWEIDVKSNRKLEELGQGLYMLIENPIVGVAVTVSGIVSVGLKLP